jgi:hypothetical protein
MCADSVLFCFDTCAFLFQDVPIDGTALASMESLPSKRVRRPTMKVLEGALEEPTSPSVADTNGRSSPVGSSSFLLVIFRFC